MVSFRDLSASVDRVLDFAAFVLKRRFESCLLSSLILIGDVEKQAAVVLVKAAHEENDLSDNIFTPYIVIQIAGNMVEDIHIFKAAGNVANY